MRRPSGRLPVVIALAAVMILGVDTYLVVMSRSNVVTVDQALEDYRALTAGDPGLGADPGGRDSSGPGDPSPAAPAPTERPGEHLGDDADPPDDDAGGAAPTPAEAGPGAARPASPPAPEGTTPSEAEAVAQGPEGAPETSGWTRPGPGVYVYASSGYESVSVPGGRREMPEETAATVRHTEPGFSVQLRPYEEHVDIFEHSFDGGALGFDRWYVERTFVGQKTSQDYHCPDSEPVHVRGAPAGRVAQMVCTWEDRARTEGTYTLLGYEDVVLGDGTTVAGAPHVVIENTTSGEATGRTRWDMWLHPDTGLMLREVRDIRSNTPSALGRVDYREETRFELVSLTPRT